MGKAEPPASEGGRYNGRSAGLADSSGAQTTRRKASAAQPKRAEQAQPPQKRGDEQRGAESLHLRGGEGEFDAAADGVNAFGAVADAVAEFPGELEGGFAAGGAAAAAGVATGDGDDGVVAFAIDTAGVGGFLDGGDGQQAFDENFEEFDEAAVFLHGNDERVVLVAQMLLHELRGFPADEFAFGSGGTALGFGSFGRDFLEMLQRIDGGFGAEGGLDVRGRGRIGIGEGPFQDAMDD